MRIFIEPIGNPTASINAAIAEIVASGDPGLIEMSDATFELAGSGVKTNGNGAAVINNTTLNPSGVPIKIKGQGQGITTLKLARGNPFNMIEVVNTSGQYIANLPFELSDITLDGNGAYQAQEPDPLGDRYQNCFYACGVRGVRLLEVEAKGASYHGVALNSCHESKTRVTAHDNYCNGVLLTGNPADSLFGEAGQHDLHVSGNGISQAGQADTTYMGVIVIAQVGVGVRVVSRWHNNHHLNGITPHSGGAALVQDTVGCKIEILSRADRAALTIGHGVRDNDISVAGTLAGVVGVLELSTLANSPIRGNIFRLSIRGCPTTADLGNGASNLEVNTIYAGRPDSTVVLGPKFLASNVLRGWD